MGMNERRAEARVTSYTIFPSGWNDEAAASGAYGIFTLNVEKRGPGAWAVTRSGGECLRHDGRRWAYERMPSSRTQRFKRAYRMSEDRALALALRHVDRITFKGSTWAERWKDEWR